MCSCHFFTNWWRFLGQILQLRRNLKVHLLIFFNVLIHSKSCLSAIINLVDCLRWLLFWQLGRKLSLAWCRLVYIASFFPSEQKFNFLRHRLIGLLLCTEYHRFVLLALKLRVNLIHWRGRCSLAFAQRDITIWLAQFDLLLDNIAYRSNICSMCSWTFSWFWACVLLMRVCSVWLCSNSRWWTSALL